MNLILHAPQIRAWPSFERFEADMAVEAAVSGGTTRFGTASISGATEIDLDTRLVTIRAPKVDEVTFVGSASETLRQAVLQATMQSELKVPLDLFLAQLAEDVLSNPPPPGFNPDPPAIVVRSSPTVLLFVDGEQVIEPVSGTGLRRVVNANWPLFRADGDDGAYYLFVGEHWLVSRKLDQGWKAAAALPADFDRLPDDPDYAAVKAAVQPAPGSSPIPDVLHAVTPTELVVITGEPLTESIEGAEGLEYVTNTRTPLFRLEQTWFYPAAGRWFSAARLDGPWSYVADLPEAFNQIPADHPRGAVRASVPGTPEARMAALEALLPTRVAVATTAALPIEVTYAGDPQFEQISGVRVSRAVNVGLDVLEFQGRYYLLYAGIWYSAMTPVGPWRVTATVPPEIYRIPPSSPAYHVTQVRVAETTPTTVVYTYPYGYSTNVYVVYGVPYYGTGWYYPPYIWGRYYFPYPVAYGYGRWYNPATGRYASRSVWYGPYGGYSYNQGYNPRTGRYGYVETVWDGDEWASHGETWNPRTGVGTETSRYYDADRNSAEMERVVSRGDDWISTERSTDFDEGISQVERENSRGGSSSITHEVSDGTITTSGQGSTGDGRSYTVTGETTRSGGSGTIAGEERSVDVTTTREDGRSASTIHGSEGGQGLSVTGQGPGRTTVGQSASGDLYAGHNGNVFKRTEDGWQRYDDGEWQTVAFPTREGRASTERSRPDSTDWRTGTSTDRDFAQLNHDREARQRGARQFEQRQVGRQRLAGRSRSGGAFRR
ncbi:MAG: hypothetical protein KF911_01695 [Pseudomonadales bacterium]|nr:hypothetical protein [Pseudomonadales bacterium]